MIIFALYYNLLLLEQFYSQAPFYFMALMDRNLGHRISWDLYSRLSRNGQLRWIFACFRAHRFRTHWVAKFKVVCGPTEAADWKYCPKNGGNKLSVKQAFQRVVVLGGNLDEFWPRYRTAKILMFTREWLGLCWLVLEHKKTHQQQIAERCPVAFKAWLQ